MIVLKDFFLIETEQHVESEIYVKHTQVDTFEFLSKGTSQFIWFNVRGFVLSKQRVMLRPNF